MAHTRKEPHIHCLGSGGSDRGLAHNERIALKILITGAGGYIGGVLQQVFLQSPQVAGQRVTSIALTDRVFTERTTQGVIQIEGDLMDRLVMDRIADFAPDVTFHLAGVPGGASEADYAAGRRTNLDASLYLFEQIALQQKNGGVPPVVVYASTIAVYGANLPAIVQEETPLNPPVTYGAHKRVCEILLADFSRRGQLDGRSLRLPGIVARRSSGAGLTSAFMSDLLHALADGVPYICPVSETATAWWMSAHRCAQNLVHAAGMNVAGANAGRAWPLPVMRLSMQEIVNAGIRVFGSNRQGLVRYKPVESVEAVYGRYPVLDDAPSRALGLQDDGNQDDLVLRAVGRVT